MPLLLLFLITLGLELSDTQSTSLKYEPSLELLLITATQLFAYNLSTATYLHTVEKYTPIFDNLLLVTL